MKKHFYLTITLITVSIITAIACGIGTKPADSSSKAQIADDDGGGSTAPESACDQADFQNAYSAEFLLNKNQAEEGKTPIWPRYYEGGSTWIRLFSQSDLEPFGDLVAQEIDEHGNVIAQVKFDEAQKHVRVLAVDEEKHMLTVTPEPAVGNITPHRYLVPQNCLNCVELNNDGKYDLADQCIIYPN